MNRSDEIFSKLGYKKYPSSNLTVVYPGTIGMQQKSLLADPTEAEEKLYINWVLYPGTAQDTTQYWTVDMYMQKILGTYPISIQIGHISDDKITPELIGCVESICVTALLSAELASRNVISLLPPVNT